MTVYKLFRVRNGKLYPLYVEAGRELPVGEWLPAAVGEMVDETHVKASGCGGKLSLRPGFHSTLTPFTDWIGKRMPDGTLAQRKDTVWAKCRIRGRKLNVNGSRKLLRGWYLFRTNAKQKEPWIISDELMIERVLTHREVSHICRKHGCVAQRTEAEYEAV